MSEINLSRRHWMAGTAALLGSPFALAQMPSTLRIVVPFTPGGSTDILARAVAPKFAAALGLNVVVDNKPGAGGSIGAAEAAKSAADGSTLLMGHIGTLGVNPSIYPNLPYDPIQSFTPVGWVARVPNVLVVNSASPVKSLKELVELARRKPGQLTYSSGGNGSAAHITFESLKLAARMHMLHIPYRGSAPSITDLLSGTVDATFTGIPALMTHIRSGRLRALAVSSSTRLPLLPEVPTVAESGYPGFEADQWYGLVAPARMAPELVARLNAELNKILVLPDVVQQLAGEGAVPMPNTPAAFGALIAREMPRWREVVKAGNVKAD